VEKYARANTVSLKSHAEYNERWLQRIIAEDTTVLGLGELELLAAEHRQPRAGRLDLLLADHETRTRYEVELQLGPTDESHIIRTIEYWDNERRRLPDREHVAVIAAEDITSRFLNVITLFNRAIPLIAIQVRALDVAGVLTVHCTKVLDLTIAEVEDEEHGPEQAVDRAYWVKRGSKETVALADDLIQLIHSVTGDDQLALKYNRHYIGLAKQGIPNNYITMRPRKGHIGIDFKIPRSDELTSRLEDQGFDVLPYDARSNNYKLRLTDRDFATRHEMLMALIRQASGVLESVSENPEHAMNDDA
jgi:hypothetical protein